MRVNVNAGPIVRKLRGQGVLRETGVRVQIIIAHATKRRRQFLVK